MIAIKRKRRVQPAQIAGAAATAAALTGVAATVGRRLLRRESSPSTSGGGRTRFRRSGEGRGGGATWRCDCGQEFRVAGTERHRVYWLVGAPEAEPVMSDRCPSCDAVLPNRPVLVRG